MGALAVNISMPAACLLPRVNRHIIGGSSTLKQAQTMLTDKFANVRIVACPAGGSSRTCVSAKCTTCPTSWHPAQKRERGRLACTPMFWYAAPARKRGRVCLRACVANASSLSLAPAAESMRRGPVQRRLRTVTTGCIRITPVRCNEQISKGKPVK